MQKLQPPFETASITGEETGDVVDAQLWHMKQLMRQQNQQQEISPSRPLSRRSYKVHQIARIIRFYFTFVFGSNSACALHHIHDMAGRLQLQFDPTSC
jgi:hypothetical protein